MLVQCPECELQVSDKALACPHCGYPMKTNSEKSPLGKSRSRKYQRLPNGFGQITELKNRNLRNRFRVMISDGKTEYGKPIQKMLKPRAYFPTYKEAYEALLEYHKNPYDLSKDLTVEQLYNEWFKHYCAHAKVQDSTNAYVTAWNYCSSLQWLRNIKWTNMPLRESLDTRFLILQNQCILNGIQTGFMKRFARFHEFLSKL